MTTRETDGVSPDDSQGRTGGPAEVRLAVVRAPADTVRVGVVGASLRNQREPADSLRVDVTMP